MAPTTSPDTGGVNNPWHQMLFELRHPDRQRVGWETNADLMRDAADEIERLSTPTPRKAEGWQDISTAPRDGTDILILAGGMAIQAWYSPGSWGPDIPGEVREYDGAAWVAFDDLTQFEIEEGALEGGQDHHGAVTHWMPLPAPPSASVSPGIFAPCENEPKPAHPAQDGIREKAVKVCPQCDGEGYYADGVDEAACSTPCTRCDGNGWIVDLALSPAHPAQGEAEGMREKVAAALEAMPGSWRMAAVFDVADAILALTGRAGPATETGRMEP